MVHIIGTICFGSSFSSFKTYCIFFMGRQSCFFGTQICEVPPPFFDDFFSLAVHAIPSYYHWEYFFSVPPFVLAVQFQRFSLASFWVKIAVTYAWNLHSHNLYLVWPLTEAHNISNLEFLNILHPPFEMHYMCLLTLRQFCFVTGLAPGHQISSYAPWSNVF